jgi:multidrug resistance efflux pump
VGNGAAAALERITKLRDQGAISHEEFAAAKARILSAGIAREESSEERRSFEAVEANVAAARDLADMSRTQS